MCGKVIIAATEPEVARIRMLRDRGRQNGVRCALLGPGPLQEREPHAQGLAALLVQDAGIVDYRAALLHMAARAEEQGVTGRDEGTGSEDSCYHESSDAGYA